MSQFSEENMKVYLGSMLLFLSIMTDTCLVQYAKLLQEVFSGQVMGSTSLLQLAMLLTWARPILVEFISKMLISASKLTNQAILKTEGNLPMQIAEEALLQSSFNSKVRVALLHLLTPLMIFQNSLKNLLLEKA